MASDLENEIDAMLSRRERFVAGMFEFAERQDYSLGYWYEGGGQGHGQLGGHVRDDGRVQGASRARPTCMP
eukprot:8043360-Heterocapsa_arctica.AAC.1